MTESKKATNAGKTTAAKATARKAPAKKAAPQKAAPAKKANAKAAKGQQVTIDGKSYSMDALSDNAKSQINNLRATDRMISELELELSIARTARNSYSEALERELAGMNTTLQ